MEVRKGQESLLKTFLKYIFLNIIGMIGLSCYILADTYFVAKGFGADGLTALNLAIPIYSFISGIGLMIGMGGATRYAILKGQQKQQDMNLVFTRSVMLAALCSMLLVLVGIFLSNSITTLLGADLSVHEMTKNYLLTILLFSPFFIMNNLLICFIRNDGNPRLAMTAMLTGSFSNIVLDYIFIFPFSMGMFGAALATGLAPIISMLILSIHFIKKKHNFKFIRIKQLLQGIFDIAALGSASLIMEVSSGVVMLVFNLIILRLEGNIGIAAYGIIANLALVATAVFTGVTQGIQPIVSFHYGRGNKENTRKLYRYALLASSIIAVVIYAVSYIYSDMIISVFNKDNNIYLAGLAKNGMHLYFMAFLFVGFNAITAAYFSATDKPMVSFLISVLRGAVIIIPMAFLLSAGFGITGIWITLTCTEILTAIFAGRYYALFR